MVERNQIDPNYFNNKLALEGCAADILTSADQTFFQKALRVLYLTEVKILPSKLTDY